MAVVAEAWSRTLDAALWTTRSKVCRMSAATVTLGFLPDAVTLDVYDDGAGFDPAAAAPPSDDGGYGLRAMRQRVEQLGGTFSVESAPGEGTIVAAQLPAGPSAASTERSQA